MAKINYQLNNNIPAFKNFLGIVVILIIAFILNSQIENLQGGTALSLSLWLGIAFGAVLQKSRFCFYCLSRDFIELKKCKRITWDYCCSYHWNIRLSFNIWSFCY